MMGMEWSAILAFGVGIVLIYIIGKVISMPVRLVFRLIYNGLIGGVMLWVVNLIGGHVGFSLAINPLTALIAGFLGLPGVVLLVLFKLFIAG
jgi:inhibitor of the pro-sigma K processing machinery